MGVRAISVGVNDASAPPGVPKNTPFIWQDARTNTSLIGMLHPGARPRAQPLLCTGRPLSREPWQVCGIS